MGGASMTLENLQKVLTALHLNVPETAFSPDFTEEAKMQLRRDAIKITQDEIKVLTPEDEYTAVFNLDLANATGKMLEESKIDPDGALERYRATAEGLGLGVVCIDSVENGRAVRASMPTELIQFRPKGEVIFSKQGHHFATTEGAGREETIRCYEGPCDGHGHFEDREPYKLEPVTTQQVFDSIALDFLSGGKH